MVLGFTKINQYRSNAVNYVLPVMNFNRGTNKQIYFKYLNLNINDNPFDALDNPFGDNNNANIGGFRG